MLLQEGLLARLLAPAALPASADPRVPHGHSRIVVTGHAACGCPIKARQVCTGYDRHKRPVYTNYRQPFVCGCNKDSRHVNARRKFNERRDNEHRNHQERLHKVYAEYQKDLDGTYRKHNRELDDIEEDRYRNPRKFRERRENEERNHRKRLWKVEENYQKDLKKVHDKHQRELDDQYRDYLRAIR